MRRKEMSCDVDRCQGNEKNQDSTSIDILFNFSGKMGHFNPCSEYGDVVHVLSILYTVYITYGV